MDGRTKSFKLYCDSLKKIDEQFGYEPAGIRYYAEPGYKVAGLNAIAEVFATIKGPVTEGVKSIYRGMHGELNGILEFVFPSNPQEVYINMDAVKDGRTWETVTAHAIAGHAYQFENGKLAEFKRKIEQMSIKDAALNSFLNNSVYNDELFKKIPYKMQFSRDIVSMTNLLVRFGLDKNRIEYYQKHFYNDPKRKDDFNRNVVAEKRGRTYADIYDDIYKYVKEKWDILEEQQPNVVLKEGFASYIHEKFSQKWFNKTVLDVGNCPPQYMFGQLINFELENQGHDPVEIALELDTDRSFFRKAKSLIDMDKIWTELSLRYALPPIDKVAATEKEKKIEENRRKYALVSAEGMKKYYDEIMSSSRLESPKPIEKIAEFESKQMQKNISIVKINTDIVRWMKDEEIFLISHLFYDPKLTFPEFPYMISLNAGNIIGKYSVGMKVKKNASKADEFGDPYYIPRDFKGFFSAHFFSDEKVELEKEMQEHLPGKLDENEKYLINEAYKFLISEENE